MQHPLHAQRKVFTCVYLSVWMRSASLKVAEQDLGDCKHLTGVRLMCHHWTRPLICCWTWDRPLHQLVRQTEMEASLQRVIKIMILMYWSLWNTVCILYYEVCLFFYKEDVIIIHTVLDPISREDAASCCDLRFSDYSWCSGHWKHLCTLN